MLCLTDVLVARTAGTPARPPAPPSLRTAVRDPYPLYRTLRTHHPLVYDEPFGAWLVSRYDDVSAALADPGSSPCRARGRRKPISTSNGRCAGPRRPR
ncbi:cytochrome P450 [Streptomyces sp. AD2-2]|nr:cytochrome P450 [Streptomyces sp. AD2-2]